MPFLETIKRNHCGECSKFHATALRPGRLLTKVDVMLVCSLVLNSKIATVHAQRTNTMTCNRRLVPALDIQGLHSSISNTVFRM